MVSFIMVFFFKWALSRVSRFRPLLTCSDTARNRLDASRATIFRYRPRLHRYSSMLTKYFFRPFCIPGARRNSDKHRYYSPVLSPVLSGPLWSSLWSSPVLSTLRSSLRSSLWSSPVLSSSLSLVLSPVLSGSLSLVLSRNRERAPR